VKKVLVFECIIITFVMIVVFESKNICLSMPFDLGVFSLLWGEMRMLWRERNEIESECSVVPSSLQCIIYTRVVASFHII
jgi:hypothetical protein